MQRDNRVPADILQCNADMQRRLDEDVLKQLRARKQILEAKIRSDMKALDGGILCEMLADALAYVERTHGVVHAVRFESSMLTDSCRNLVLQLEKHHRREVRDVYIIQQKWILHRFEEHDGTYVRYGVHIPFPFERPVPPFSAPPHVDLNTLLNTSRDYIAGSGTSSRLYSTRILNHACMMKMLNRHLRSGRMDPIYATQTEVHRLNVLAMNLEVRMLARGRPSGTRSLRAGGELTPGGLRGVAVCI